MIDRLYITKRGFVARRRNRKTRKYSRKLCTFNLHHLRVRCEIQRGVTLGDIFAAVDSDEDLKHFIGNYSWCPKIDEFHAQAREPRPKKERRDIGRITHLEVAAELEVDLQWGAQQVLDFYGISEDGTRWCVSYTPLNEIAHLPVKVIHKLAVLAGSAQELWKGKYGVCLLEVLDAIYHDISFEGGPEDNKRFLKELKRRDAEKGGIPIDEYIAKFQGKKNTALKSRKPK